MATTMKKTGIYLAISLMVVLSFLSACRRRTSSTPSSTTEQTKTSILQSLPNAEYPIELTSTGKALLKDGVFEEPAAPGAATKTRVSLGEERASGDLNSNGVQDAAVILIGNPGGSGTFFYLAAVLNQNGIARPVASAFLGDRILVKSLAIRSGEILVTLLTRESEEPMATDPTVEVTRKFKLQGDHLAELP